MLPLQFFGQNVHFAISLFAALVFFAVFWLYFDAWLAERQGKVLIKWLGFLLLALSFLINSTVIEQSVLGRSLLGNVSQSLALIFQIIGYAGIILGQLLDPLQAVPDSKGLDEADFTKAKPAAPTTVQAVGFGSVANISHLLAPLGSLTITLLYWRRATKGLERHYKPVAVSFGLLFAYDILSLASLWRATSNPTVARLVESFGALWIAQQVLLLAAAIILGRWVWQYLTRRFMSQLFMIFTSLTLAIFLLTTVSFTFLLVNNVQKNSLDNLQTAAGVLGYAINGKESETLANTHTVAENPAIATAVNSKDHKSLVALTNSFLHDKKQSSLIVTNTSGQVLLRAEDPDRFGDSLSSDTLIRRALIGQASSSVTAQSGVLAPVIYIRSAVPVQLNGQVVGAAVVSLAINNAFTDGIKHSTGLDSAIYAGNIRSATTFVAPDGSSRWVGVKETNHTVQTKVLKQAQTFKGALSIQNRQYLAVYAPLKDIDNTVIGMLFIGQPQAAILQAAGHSVELTFLVTALLLVLSIIPAYVIARYITKQL